MDADAPGGFEPQVNSQGIANGEQHKDRGDGHAQAVENRIPCVGVVPDGRIRAEGEGAGHGLHAVLDDDMLDRFKVSQIASSAG